jgi:hypothetical protein
LKFIRTAVDEIRLMTNEEREEYEERAAILEFDAGMERRAAEALALEMCRKQQELF